MHKLAFTLSLAILGISACTNTDNPQLAMCQAVTQQLTGSTVASWDSDSKSDGSRTVDVKVDFTSANGQTGNMKCAFKKHGDGTVDTAPTTVVFNNQPVNRKILIEAGTLASKELLTGTYKNTVAKSAELAGDAAVKANELALQARDAAIKGAQTLQQLQELHSR